MNTVKKANKTQMKRVAKMMKEYFGINCHQVEVFENIIPSAIPTTSVAIIDGNTISWEGNYEWNEKFNEWFHRNKAFFNCGNLWYENQNGYSISVYCG